MQLGEYLTLTGQSPSAFAGKIKVPASTITRILRGERTPQLDTVAKIKVGTGGAVTADDLTPAQKPPPKRRRRAA